jgi:aryl-alcohol dehydrogenase-like predicted oxidoreductase
MSFRLLDGFVDAGFNFIDTADVYSNGRRAIMAGSRRSSSANG